MAVIDWGILAVLAVSALIGLKRGFLYEIISLATWVTAFIVARLFSGQLATLLSGTIETVSLRWVVAFSVLFAGTIVIGAMLNHLVNHFIEATGLTGADRVFGMVFGVVRGVVICLAVVYGLQQTAVTQDAWWSDSQFIPYLSTLASWVSKTLPDSTGQFFSFT